MRGLQATHGSIRPPPHGSRDRTDDVLTHLIPSPHDVFRHPRNQGGEAVENGDKGGGENEGRRPHQGRRTEVSERKKRKQGKTGTEAGTKRGHWPSYGESEPPVLVPAGLVSGAQRASPCCVQPGRLRGLERPTGRLSRPVAEVGLASVVDLVGLVDLDLDGHRSPAA